MKLLQVTVLCLLLSSLCSSEDTTDNKQTTPALSTSTISTTPTPATPNFVQSTVGTPSKGITDKKPLQTLPWTTPSLTITVKSAGATTNAVTKNEFITTNATVTNLPPPTAVATLQSSQQKTENQSSIKTTERSVSTPQPDASPSSAGISPSVLTAIPENISRSQGNFESAKNASSSSTSPSYSSVILPVVIALIVITLSAFAAVGLYRVCRKTDPGTPENGNDQPQSDKESVKLLTVKTISHESGEHSAQGKTKN